MKTGCSWQEKEQALMATEPVHGGVKHAYLLDTAWQHARQRLVRLESRLDPGSIHLHTPVHSLYRGVRQFRA